MPKLKVLLLLTLAVLWNASPLLAQTGKSAGIRGWLSWRGPNQNGTSPETGLPDTIAADSPAWTYTVRGRATPVIANGRVYAMGYEGEGKSLEELIVCLDEATGKKIWEHRWADFLSDIVYYRFAITSPCVDPETGDVTCLSTAGLLTCFSRDGRMLWQRSMMEEYGRLTFPNGRTVAPVIDGDLCIIHVATSGWGPHAPARDRFFAFNKKTGTNVWSCTPGGPPKDASFSYPVVATEDGRRVLYAGLAGGHVVCVDVRTGDPLWKFQMSIGGMSSSPVLYKDSIIAAHGKENLDTSTIGRMIALKRGGQPTAGSAQVKLGKDSEIWRNDLVAFTSSMVLVDNRVYQTVMTGELYCIDADTGKKIWHEKLAPDQIHASPAYADGKLYVPMNNGTLHVIKPSDDGPEVLSKTQLSGNCLGAPAICNGRVYVHTTETLYCFGKSTGSAPAPRIAPPPPAPGKAVRLRIVPGDFVIRQRDSVQLKVQSLDANGVVVDANITGAKSGWKGTPILGLGLSPTWVMQANNVTKPGSAFLTATVGDLTATARVRAIPGGAFSTDFEATKLRAHPKEEGVNFSTPPSWWVSAMKKWEIREDGEGGKILAKTLDMPLFQRNIAMLGDPDMSGYTVQVDIKTDGNRRTMSSGGVVNQRYLIVLKGNHQEVEISSNMELLRETAKYRWKARKWHRLKTRVDMQKNGSAVIRAKVWPRDSQEPKEWLLEVVDPNGHTHGAPGIYGFTPQSRFCVYLDNYQVTINE